MFNSKLIKILKEEVKLKKELIELQQNLIERLFEENNKILEIFNNITKKENTTENNVFLKQNSDYKLNDPIDLSVEGNVVIEGKL